MILIIAILGVCLVSEKKGKIYEEKISRCVNIGKSVTLFPTKLSLVLECH